MSVSLYFCSLVFFLSLTTNGCSCHIFQVKIPDEIMLEADTTLATLAPIIKAGGAVPQRWLYRSVMSLVD